jgi:hypothetical protein
MATVPKSSLQKLWAWGEKISDTFHLKIKTETNQPPPPPKPPKLKKHADKAAPEGSEPSQQQEQQLPVA